MDLWKQYHDEMPAFLEEAMQTPPMRRLRQVGMNCGCEYTGFPRFERCMSYSRFDHSLGVAMIVWHFTKDPAQTLAGLFHDISTPTFAHVVDFLLGDYLRQEATEDGTERMIHESAEIQKVLLELGLTTSDVCDYHSYPIADNNSPKLSADRLEYTLGNLVQFEFGDRETALALYEDIVVGVNEEGAPELQFRTKEKAEQFAEFSLQCAKLYVCDEDRYSMQMLSELLKDAISQNILTERDLEKTEPEVIQSLCSSQCFSERWQKYCSYRSILVSKQPRTGEGWRRIHAKKRNIDPLICGLGRVSAVCPEYGARLKEFRSESQDYWICGRAEPAV